MNVDKKIKTEKKYFFWMLFGLGRSSAFVELPRGFLFYIPKGGTDNLALARHSLKSAQASFRVVGACVTVYLQHWVLQACENGKWRFKNT